MTKREKVDVKISAKARAAAASAMGRTSRWDDQTFTISKGELAQIRTGLHEVQMTASGAAQLRAMRLETMLTEYEEAIDFRAQVEVEVDKACDLNDAVETCMDGVKDELRVSSDKFGDVLQDYPEATKEELLSHLTDAFDEEVERIKKEVVAHLEVLSKAVEDHGERMKGLIDVDT